MLNLYQRGNVVACVRAKLSLAFVRQRSFFVVETRHHCALTAIRDARVSSQPLGRRLKERSARTQLNALTTRRSGDAGGIRIA